MLSRAPLRTNTQELRDISEAVANDAPRFLQRVVTAASDWAFCASYQATPLRVIREMSVAYSRDPSSVTENDTRMKNNRTTSNTQHDTPPPSPATSSDRGSKACCFCWCCCCSCSCLTVKNGEDNKNQSKDTKLDNLNEKEEPPTAEDIRSWSESFDKLMSNPAGRKVFREFLRSEYSEENMLFWLACEDLKRTENLELVEEKARLIYEDYISILSPKEVSLDSRVREVINRNMVEPTPHSFDEAQMQIYTLMHRDSYLRFLNSQIFKKLLQSI